MYKFITNLPLKFSSADIRAPREPRGPRGYPRFTAASGTARPARAVFALFNQPRICSTCQPPIYLIFWLCIVHITICLAEVSVYFDDVLLLNEIFRNVMVSSFFRFFFSFFPLCPIRATTSISTKYVNILRALLLFSYICI